MSSSTSSDDALDGGEAMYLVVKFLESQEGMQDTLRALKQDLAHNNLFGTVHDWSGGSRRATLEDVESKHMGVPREQLMGHLKQSMKTSEEKSGT
tara:strand:+ start:87 stop:371 length:285 start_codon:yes stop_codon:yes gene_type:complete